MYTFYSFKLFSESGCVLQFCEFLVQQQQDDYYYQNEDIFLEQHKISTLWAQCGTNDKKDSFDVSVVTTGLAEHQPNIRTHVFV